MIHLDIEEYCHECPDFSPVVDRTYTRTTSGHVMALDNGVFCEHCTKCARIAQYLRMKMEKENKKDDDRNQNVQ